MIVIAPTAFKGTLSAAEVARAMAAGVRAVSALPYREQPMSDGGPGLIDALNADGAGELMSVEVEGPLGDVVSARILVRDRAAILESADACGLHLVPAERRAVLRASTRGVGQLLIAADALDVDRVIIGLGGSATVDGGRGVAEAMAGRQLRHPLTALADVRTRLADAARVFGPQKGATPAEVATLQQQLQSQLADAAVPDFEGAGAAGGLGYGLRVFLNAEVVSGSDWVIREVGLDRLVAGADVVITGEGAYDAQSGMGKITGAIVVLARGHGVPVLVVTGRAERKDGYAQVVDDGGARLDASAIRRLVTEHLPPLV